MWSVLDWMKAWSAFCWHLEPSWCVPEEVLHVSKRAERPVFNGLLVQMKDSAATWLSSINSEWLKC